MYLGNDKDYLTTRVAYKLNLRGPAMTILTACSSSLVAVCQACQSLLCYQCDKALAGGVTVIVPQTKGYLYQEGGMTSPDGHCKPFDAQAQGTLFGSGVGLVVLKRLNDAVADRDHIYAVIKGSALNNDGAGKVSYTAPSVAGQAEVIVLAQAVAGVSPDSIDYIEAHGTGTPLGDLIEVAALTQAFRECTDKRGFCGIGSLKSNIGHLDAASGIAGLIKTALALKNELIPPTLHFTVPNPKIDFASSPFYVVSKPTELKKKDQPRRAGVSAFGVGGTNAHVVLEEAPAVEPSSGSSRGTHLLKLSAKTSAALDRATSQLAAHLKAHPEINLADVAYTLDVGRCIFPQRRVVVCRDAMDAAELEEKLSPQEVMFRHLRTSHAFHSPMMDPMLAPFAEVVRRIRLQPPRIPYISNVTAKWMTAEDATNPNYWAGHVRQPVRFADGIAQFLQDPATILLEVGPGQTLSTLARQHPEWKREQAELCSLVRGEESDSIVVARGGLWLAGASVDANALFAGEVRKRVPLPTYSFERTRHRVEPGEVTWTATPASAPISCVASSTPTTRGVTERPCTKAVAIPPTRTDELKAMLKELSGKDYSDADDNVSFVELGFESLFLTQVSLAIATRFGAQVAFRQLLGELNTLGLLAAHLNQAVPVKSVSNPPLCAPVAAGPQTAPLTEAQRELWLATMLGDAASCVFNLSTQFRLKGNSQREALDGALKDLVHRHDGLRATFSGAGDSQTVAPHITVNLPFHDLTGRAAELDAMLAEEASRSFDLARGPVVRARLVKLDEDDHVLLLTVHHIVCDGRSPAILATDLDEFYSARCARRAPALPPAQSLMEYALEENRRMETPERAAAESYWLRQYSTEPPALELPRDFARPAQKSFRGALAKFELPPALCAELNRAGAQNGCTFFTTLLAACAVFLHRLTGQEDIVLGLPFATPGTEESETLVGHTVNFLAVCARVSGKVSWDAHLREVKRLMIEAIAHRDFTYGSLLQKLNLARDSSRIPLVSASFNLARRHEPSRFAGHEVTKETNPHSFTNLDLTFDFNQDGEAVSLDCIYNSDLFDAETIQRWLRHFETLLHSIVENPVEEIAKLALLGEIERREQIVEWNDTAVEIPKFASVSRWFESQAEKTPQARALRFEGKGLTYRELNERANRLARHLKRLGVGPDVKVGLYVDRSFEMVVGLLGILKAGGAYVPFDPSFPLNRLACMAEDSGMRALVTHRNLEKKLPALPASVVRLDSDWPEISAQDHANPNSEAASPENLAYVLYTSGSTGKPKGVEIPHSALINFLFSMQREPGFAPGKSLLAVTTLSFDIAGLEIYLPLVSGGTVVIAKHDDSRDPAKLIQLLRDAQCDVMQATPSTWGALIDAGWSGSPTLKVLCGGESLPRDLAQELLPRCKELWNLYGPTETTIWSTLHRVTSADGTIPIGRPIANTQAFVLDSYRNLVPIGSVGELYIGGAGLARGYLGRPELTRERFVENPFDPRAAVSHRRYGAMAAGRNSGMHWPCGQPD